MSGWLLLACAGGSPALLPVTDPMPRGARSLGMALVPRASDFDLAGVWQLAREAGATEPGDVNVDWAAWESSPGVYADPDGSIAFTTSLPDLERVSVTLAPFQTTYLSVPDDLAGRAWDDPELQARYVAAARALLDQLGDLPVHSFAVGNEVDALLGDEPQVWAQWADLVRATREALAQSHPGVAVGVKLTVDGWAKPNAGLIAAQSEVAIATWYPIDARFGVLSDDRWLDPLDGLLANTALPVYVAEIGIPSDAVNGSSEAAQQRFVHDVFAWWDAHPDRVPTMVFVWSHDLQPEMLEALVAGYGVDDPAFGAYIGSLGLHRQDGAQKPAWAQLQAEASARGFQTSSAP